jgi:hypothetical protein
VSRREEIDIDDVLSVVGDNLGKADACITAAERLFGQPGASAITDTAEDEDGEHDHDDDNDPSRVRNNLEHLVECTKLAVRAAQYAHDQTLVKLDRYCADPVQGAEVTAIAIGNRRGKA